MDWNNINRDRDTSGLGPIEYDQTKVPALIRKHADNVRTKTYGQEVREAQARNAELAGLIASEANHIAVKAEESSNHTETRLDNQIGSLTQESELIDSRVSASGDIFTNLKKRLDNAEAYPTISASTQEIISGDFKVKSGQIVTTSGFYTRGDSGGYRYVYEVKTLTGNEDFKNTVKGFNLTYVGEIQVDTNLKLVPIIGKEILIGQLGANDNNDDVVLKTAFEMAKTSQLNINLNVNVNLLGTIDIYRAGDDRKIIEFSGKGHLSKTNKGYMFINSLNRSGGNIKFNGINFVSEAGVGTLVFHGGYMLRMYFENCKFDNVDQLTWARDSTANFNYLQTIYLSSCIIVGGKGDFVDAMTAYDVSITHSIVEHRENFLRIDYNHSVRVTDNLIEGLDGYVGVFKDGRALVIDNNYMEHNCKLLELQPYITYGNSSNTKDSFDNLSIKDNLFIADDIHKTNSDYYLIRVNHVRPSHNINDNFADANLIKVTSSQSLYGNAEKVKEFISNNVIGNKYAANNFKASLSPSIGSGNANKGFKYPLSLDDFWFNNSDKVQTILVTEETVRMVKMNGIATDKIGLVVNEKFRVNSNTNYVVGLRAKLVQNFSETDHIAVEVYEASTEEVVSSTKFDIQNDTQNEGKYGWYTLPPFTSTSPKLLNVRVYIWPKSQFSATNQIYLDIQNIVIQRGDIATDAVIN